MSESEIADLRVRGWSADERTARALDPQHQYPLLCEASLSEGPTGLDFPRICGHLDG